jgi:asparagine synthase (glutamine-hydrolysing)
MPLPRAYRTWVGMFSESALRAMVRPEWLSPQQLASDSGEPVFDVESFMHSRPAPADGRSKQSTFRRWLDPVQAASHADYRSYLPGDILTKVDRAGMRVALEVRSPFLDHKVVELALSLPSEWKLRGRVTKWILREAFKDIVPPSVWTQPKRGFSLPLDRWLRGDLLGLLRESVACLPDDVFDRAWIDELIARHQSGREEHSLRLWALLWLGRWWKRFVG